MTTTVLKKLQRDLDKLFSVPAVAAPSRQPGASSQRRKAKAIAAQIGVEIDYDRQCQGYWVIPPESIENTERDPFCGDHFAVAWSEILYMVEKYQTVLDNQTIR